MKKLYTILFVLCFGYSFAQSPTLIVNEISQGTGQSKDYVEFLVVGNCSTGGTLDLRGWILDDNTGQFGGVGEGNTSGCVRFADNPVWQNVPVGSIIVIYNDSPIVFKTDGSGDEAGSSGYGPNGLLIPFLLADDPDDTGKRDSVYVVPAKSTLLEHHTDPKSTALGGTDDYPLTGYLPGGYTSSIGNTFSFGNPNDAIQIRKPDPPGNTYLLRNSAPEFSIEWTQQGAANVSFLTMATLRTGVLTDSLLNLSNLSSGNWVNFNPLTNPSIQTPGKGNGGADNSHPNNVWIANMRKIPRPDKTISFSINGKSEVGLCVGDSPPVLNFTDPLQSNHTYTIQYLGTTTTASEPLINPVAGSGANANVIINNLASTRTFQVQVTDQNGCVEILDDTVRIEVNPLPALNMSTNTTVCVGEVSRLTAEQSLNSYLWSPADSLIEPDSAIVRSPEVSPKVTTTYTLIGTDTNGCKNTGNVTFTVVPKPKIGITQSQICTPANLLGFTTDGNSTNPVFGLYSDASLTAKVADSSQVDAAGPYFVSAISSSGCRDTLPVTINKSPVFDIERQGVSVLCEGIPVNVEDSVDSDVPATVINYFSDSKYLNTHQSSNNIIATDTIYFSQASTGGCESKDSIILTFTSSDSIGFTLTDLCDNETNLPTVDLINGSTRGGVFSSVTSNFTINSSTGVIQSVTDTGNYTVQYRTTGTCPDTLTKTGRIKPAPNPQLTLNCIGNGFQGLIVVNPQVASSYEWFVEGLERFGARSTEVNFDDIHSLMPGTNNPDTVTFYLRETNSDGCTDTVAIDNKDVKYSDITVPDFSVCRGESFYVDSLVPVDNSNNLGIGTVTYHSSSTTDSSRNNKIQLGQEIKELRSFDIFALKTVGCPSLDTVTINVMDIPNPIYTYLPEPPTQTDSVVQFFDQTIGGDQSIWQISGNGFQVSSTDNAPIITFPDSGTYNVQLVSVGSNNCRDTTITQIVVEADLNVFIPTGFSPNSDAINEYFTPIVTSNAVVNYHFEIYNSWGQLIYESKNKLDTSWDGMVNGQQAQVGAYVYNLTYEYKTDEVNHKGVFYLIR